MSLSHRCVIRPGIWWFDEAMILELGWTWNLYELMMYIRNIQNISVILMMILMCIIERYLLMENGRPPAQRSRWVPSPEEHEPAKEHLKLANVAITVNQHLVDRLDLLVTYSVTCRVTSKTLKFTHTILLFEYVGMLQPGFWCFCTGLYGLDGISPSRETTMTARNVWPWECLQVHNPAKMAFFATLGVWEWLETQIHNSWSIHSHHQKSLVLEPAKWNIHNIIYIISCVDSFGDPNKGRFLSTMSHNDGWGVISDDKQSQFAFSFAPCNSPSFHDEDVEEAVPSIWTSVRPFTWQINANHIVFHHWDILAILEIFGFAV